jgi:hypothetical protein
MCTLRTAGAEFDVYEFLRGSPFEPCKVFRRGEPRLPRSNPEGQTQDASGFNLSVSDAPWDNLPAQVADVESFLREHESEVGRLREFPGVESVSLDFPISLDVNTEVVAQFHRFPESLVRSAGRLGLGLELSVYASSHEAESSV